MLNLKDLKTRFGRQADLPKQVVEYRRIPQEVLMDLAAFCGAADPAPREGDMFLQGRAAGRRDVWLRIASHLALEPHELYALLKGQPIVREDHNG